jgi:hypothetical protein
VSSAALGKYQDSWLNLSKDYRLVGTLFFCFVSMITARAPRHVEEATTVSNCIDTDPRRPPSPLRLKLSKKIQNTTNKKHLVGHDNVKPFPLRFTLQTKSKTLTNGTNKNVKE